MSCREPLTKKSVLQNVGSTNFLLPSNLLKTRNWWPTLKCQFFEKKKLVKRNYKFYTEESLTACSYHVTYTFQVNSHSILLAWNRQKIWSLSNWSSTWTYNHLVHKRTLNRLAKPVSLAKWLSVCLWTKWLWVPVQLQSRRGIFAIFSRWTAWVYERKNGT